jgi:hypothetical protein
VESPAHDAHGDRTTSGRPAPRLGRMSVDDVIERQVVRHLSEHARQLDEILG